MYSILCCFVNNMVIWLFMITKIIAINHVGHREDDVSNYLVYSPGTINLDLDVLLTEGTKNNNRHPKAII